MNRSYSAALFVNKQRRAYKDVVSTVSEYFNVIEIVDAQKKCNTKKYQRNISKADLVISIFNHVRVVGEALAKPNFNIHAAPSWYRGVGAIGRALAERRAVHGIVLHKMVDEFDAGDILMEDTFSIVGLSAREIGGECVRRALIRLRWVCEYFSENGVLPDSHQGAQWTGEVMRLAEFRVWLEDTEFEEKDEVIKMYSPLWQKRRIRRFWCGKL